MTEQELQFAEKIKEVVGGGIVRDIDFLNQFLEVNIGDRQFRLVADFDNLDRIQRSTARGELGNLNFLTSPMCGVSDVAKLISLAIDPKDTRTNAKEIGQHLLKNGLYQSYVSLMVAYFNFALYGGSLKEEGKPTPSQ